MTAADLFSQYSHKLSFLPDFGIIVAGDRAAVAKVSSESDLAL